jgi:DNA-binding MarR family transcriptional regulator
VAKVLLEFAGDANNERNRLAQRDIAAITGKDWQTVYMSLKSLDLEGVIRIERNRITINKELLQKIAGFDTM